MQEPTQAPRVLGVTITYCNRYGEVRHRTLHANPADSEREWVGGLVWEEGAFGTVVTCGRVDEEAETHDVEGDEGSLDCRPLPGSPPAEIGVRCAESAPQSAGFCWWDPVRRRWVCPMDLD